MMRCTCPHCGAYYYAPDARPEKLLTLCKGCGAALRVVCLTDEEYAAEMAALDTLEEMQAQRTHTARRDARAYRGGLAGWGVQV